MNQPNTFRQIEKMQKIALLGDLSGQSPLSSWYESIRDKPLSEFSVNDLAKSIRQGLNLDYVLPVAIEQLNLDPLAGELYDGELLVAVSAIPKEFWLTHAALRKSFDSILGNSIDTNDTDVLAAIEALHRILSDVS